MAELAERAAQPRLKAVPRENQIAERKREILDATIIVIGRDGLTGLTMKTISDAAKCSFGVAAFHFRSKEGLLLAALDLLVEEYEQVRRPRSEAKIGPGHAVARRLKALVDTDFDGRVAGLRQIAVWVAFWAETARNEAYRARCAELKDRYHRLTVDDVAALAAARKLTVDADQVAATLNAIVDGFWIANLVLRRSDPAGRAAGREACLTYLRTIFPEDF